jgi:hypothetical protein
MKERPVKEQEKAMEREQRCAAKRQMIAFMQAGHGWQEAAAMAGLHMVVLQKLTGEHEGREGLVLVQFRPSLQTGWQYLLNLRPGARVGKCMVPKPSLDREQSFCVG